jgi:hypothetical protein
LSHSVGSIGGSFAPETPHREQYASSTTRIGVAAPSIPRSADRSVQAGTSYAYQVRAHNGHYASAWSNAVSVVTPAAP